MRAKEAQPAPPFLFWDELTKAMTVRKKTNGASPNGLHTRNSESRRPNNQQKRVRNYEGHARKIISVEFLSILEALAKKSVQGSLAHTKYLFEIGGVKEDIKRRVRAKNEPSLAELLVAEIRKRKIEDLPVIPEDTGASGATESNAQGNTGERGGDCKAREL